MTVQPKFKLNDKVELINLNYDYGSTKGVIDEVRIYGGKHVIYVIVLDIVYCEDYKIVHIMEKFLKLA